MKRISVVFLAAAAVLLCVCIAGKKFFSGGQDASIRSKLIIPSAQDIGSEAAEVTKHSYALTNVLVPLRKNETLISVYTADLNADTYDDQIVALKNSGNPYITLIVGLYNPQQDIYERKFEIATEIAQAGTFSYTVMDITGEKSAALVYSGFSDNGDSVLAAFVQDLSAQSFSMKKSVDLRADSSIFIQPVYRSEKYAMSLETGDSFPIWVYKTDSSRSSDSYDQLQIMYNWDHESGSYVPVSETRITEKRMEEKERVRIQDGTVKTFTNFLDGLWYKVSNNGREIRYLFFDAESKEIIFLFDTTQEVYTWQNSILRRNGIYLSMVNTSIANLMRRLDIMLISSDSIRVKLSDDLGMVIGEETLWDGLFKKMQTKSASDGGNAKTESSSKIDAALQTDAEPWQTKNGETVQFENGQFSIRSEHSFVSGAYTFVRIGNTELLQFRPKKGSVSVLDGFYLIKSLDADEKNQKEILELIPYTAAAAACIPSGLPAVRLERNISAAVPE
ncbi:MAG: pallilysin-related adhesin [Bacteroides sp.]|nr:pallilysin-related adhesin [Prevotella sp.]MCM1408604.1 pallilysin-related adhesin [Treponema brennaborense]MCM1468908.1 pallilysin-related adhesin [Bacteroides sp.]